MSAQTFINVVLILSVGCIARILYVQMQINKAMHTRLIRLETYCLNYVDSELAKIRAQL